MVFSSLTFIGFFLPAVILLSYMCKAVCLRHAGFDASARLLLMLRNAVLIIFSLFFYAWGEPKWIICMLLSVLVNYICALLIGHAATQRARMCWMLAGVITSLAFLIYFKYFSFIANTFLGIIASTANVPSKILPIGISFYTFQILTYTIDVYRRKSEPQKNPFKLLLYISFFPQLIAGPIVNYSDIREALSCRAMTLNGLYSGMMRFMIGFAKKILLANVCGEILGGINTGSTFSFTGAWLGAFAYALQIYFDFSGYSDMAIGMGKILGFDFKENFNYPYISQSITEFWRRWHISLGTFFRDYVYIPLGGNRVSEFRLVLNLLIVWGLTGLWHGASWNFVVWGLYYGILLIIEKTILSQIKFKLPKPLHICLTLILVLVGWVIFYYEDIGRAFSQIQAMFGVNTISFTDNATVYYFKQYFGFLLVGILACIPWKQSRLAGFVPVRITEYAKPVAVTLCFLVSLAFLVGQSYNPFLYFRF